MYPILVYKDNQSENFPCFFVEAQNHVARVALSSPVSYLVFVCCMASLMNYFDITLKVVYLKKQRCNLQNLRK